MSTLLKFSSFIDEFNKRIGRLSAWCIVLAATVGAGNALLRKLFDLSSNAWLEIQWWLFSISFLFASSWALRDNDHIRIDIVHSLISQRLRHIIELLGHLFFLLPSAVLLFVTSWNYFAIAWMQNEQSKDAGGLPQWPIKAIMPLAFALLVLQALSQIIKQISLIREGTLVDNQNAPSSIRAYE